MMKILFVVLRTVVLLAMTHTAFATDVTLRLVDQHGVLIPGSQFQVEATFVPNDVTVNLPAGTYTVNVLPGINGITQVADLYRIMNIVVSGATQTVTLAWRLETLGVTLVDQSGTPIPASQVGIPGYGLLQNGPSVVLPVTEDPSAPASQGPYRLGYGVQLNPGMNGNPQNADLYRQDYLPLQVGGSTYTPEWKLESLNVTLVDQFNVLIPASVVELPGFGPVAHGTSVILPVTVDPSSPTTQGPFSTGYWIALYPGFNGGGQNGLYRAERNATVAVGGSTHAYTWRLETLTVTLVDQDDLPIPASMLETPGYGLLMNGSSVVLPVTVDPSMNPAQGTYASGYHIYPHPGLNGIPQSGDLYRYGSDRVPLVVGGTSSSLLWVMFDCRLSIVNALEEEICFSSIVLGSLTIRNGDRFRLPVTDNTLNPGLSGSYSNGYWFEFLPGGVSEGSAQIEITGDLAFSPTEATFGANQYGLRCVAPDPHLLTSPSQFSGSETVIDFEGFANGTQILSQYGVQGVTFSLTSGGGPIATTVTNPRQFGPPGNGALANSNPTAPIPRPDLVLDFATPVNRFGFEVLTNTGDDLHVSLKCMNGGVVCGEYCFVTNLAFKWIGIEEDHLFDQVILDVTESVNGVLRFDNLRFESTLGCSTPGTVTGVVSSDCPAPGTAAFGVRVDAFRVGTGDLVGSAVTAEDGRYSIDSLIPGEYTITVVTPLGYSSSTAEAILEIGCGDTADAAFELTCAMTSSSPRSIGYWKHNVGVATGGKGAAQVSGAEICGYLDLIAAHFNTNLINQVIVYQTPASGACADKLQTAKNLLNLVGSQTMIARARQQLMALLLNIASGSIGQAEVISEDGATVSQAVTYCDNLIDDPSGDHELAKTIADRINNGQQVGAGAIPLGTADIRYKAGRGGDRELPAGFMLGQNYPNPFNPVTVIEFSLPASEHVTLVLYNVLGQAVMTLVDGTRNAGYNSVTVDASPLPSGIYTYRIRAGGYTDSRKMMLVR